MSNETWPLRDINPYGPLDLSPRPRRYRVSTWVEDKSHQLLCGDQVVVQREAFMSSTARTLRPSESRLRTVLCDVVDVKVDRRLAKRWVEVVRRTAAFER